ncbi:MAG TPA: Glu/Leu/Phe/Val dehydrogenase dimerization domain-containing protein [Acidobacteriota bacterium]|nr:Glu/Leu/Phe/Val dehydrogenase dimerization domain-containing protein [Acidobacteriota bacterium]
MPELTLEVPGRDHAHPLGWVVIDSLVRGRSHGGLRISHHVSSEELIVLARRMTLKFGFLGLANGGAKAGIVGDPESSAEARAKQLHDFAAAIRPLVESRKYLPHADMGTTEPEIRNAFGNLPRQPSREDSGYFTSIGVHLAAEVALSKRGKRLDQISGVVEGFGKVGASVAQLLAESGARVVAISTSSGALYRKEGLPIQELRRLAESRGSSFVSDYREAERITNEDLLGLPADLLCPCAISGTINAGNAPKIQAEIICPGANAPVSVEAHQLLADRGAVVLPDFITNAGGVLGGTMSFAGIPFSRIRPLMSEYLAPRFRMLFEQTPAEIEQYCLDRHQKNKIAAERGGVRQKLFETGISLYRRGLVPRFLVGNLAENYFRSR